MNHKTIFLASIFSLGLLATSGAVAKPHKDKHHGHGAHREHHHHGWHGKRERHWDGHRYQINIYEAPRGYQRRSWHHGDRMPSAYRSSRYIVNDYHNYHLHAPPRGHHWVRVDNDVVLTAITTGVVVAVVYGIFQ